MDSSKSTNELMSELREASSFGQYAESNEGGFLSESASDSSAAGPPAQTPSDSPGETFAQALSETEGTCPYCGAELLRGASFCTSCMRSLLERRIIPAKQRRTGRPARILFEVLGVLAFLAIAATVFFFLIRPSMIQKPSLELPSAAEFRILAAGASEGEEQKVWSQQAFALQKQEGEYAVYETLTGLSEEPLRIGFSDDGKRLFAALSEIPAEQSERAAKLMETLFSAVYRHYPENLDEILRKEAYYTVENGPDETLAPLAAMAGTTVPADAAVRESLPIRTDRYDPAPAARIWRITSGGQESIFILFEVSP